MLKSPLQFLGFEPGADRTLADWEQMLSYFDYLDTASKCVKKVEMGSSTEGLPFIHLIITSEQNMDNLEEIKKNHCRLADPRGMSPDEIAECVKKGKTVVMISMGIHSTEIGGVQYSMSLAHSLAQGTMPNSQQILDNTILILVPSLNPDGHKMVVDWYRKYLGTKYEGQQMPWMYHKYVGHDTNRDWYTFSQVENRLTITEIHNVWHPQIIFDMHQMGPTSARFFIPPYVDPIEPNVDPIVQQQIIWLGSAMAQELTAQDKKGVLIHGVYDAWNPARAYQHTHGGVRILTEASSCKIATPVNIKFEDMATGIGYDGKVRSWNFPEPWQGGEWHLSDIMEYERIATEACLTHAARNRETWLRNFAKIGLKAVGKNDEPHGFIIPAGQRASDAVCKMAKMFKIGQVEMYTADSDFEYEGGSYGKGTIIIPSGQPYFAFAKCLLEVQNYPDLREYPGGPPARPYDVTAFTQGLLMGVETITINQPINISMTRLENIAPPKTDVPNSNAVWADVASNDSFAMANDAFAHDIKVWRSVDKTIHKGSFIIDNNDKSKLFLEKWAEKGIKFKECIGNIEKIQVNKPRLAMYKSWTSSMDEGWTRFVLEQFGFELTSITNNDIQQGELDKKFDIIILPSMAVKAISEGLSETVVPPEYSGGLGQAGAKALNDFVSKGGNVLALDLAVDYAIDIFKLPIKNVLAQLSPKEFYIPGSLLRACVDNNHPITWGMGEEAPIWFGRSGAMTVDSGKVLIHYPSNDLLMSGWLNDPQGQLNGRSALCQIKHGKGLITCISFNPIYRAQAQSTYKLVFNGILQSGIVE